LSKGCQKDVKKVDKKCEKVVKKLSKSCQTMSKVVKFIKKLSKSRQKLSHLVKTKNCFGSKALFCNNAQKIGKCYFLSQQCAKRATQTLKNVTFS
jgi:predicted patatin/cPLA2 family phospholipase